MTDRFDGTDLVAIGSPLPLAPPTVGDTGTPHSPRRRPRTPHTSARSRRGATTTTPDTPAPPAEHGLGARELAALVLGLARVPEILDPRVVGGELAGAGGLTERQNTFAKREAVMTWAAAHGQGAPAAAVERDASQFLGRDDVHRAAGRFTTSDLLAHEHAIVSGAEARCGEGVGVVDGALVDAVLASAPFAPTAEQAAVIRGLTSSGHRVETVGAARLVYEASTFVQQVLARGEPQPVDLRVRDEDGGEADLVVAGLALGHRG